MNLTAINSETIPDAWTLFQALAKEQKTQKFIKVDFDGFADMFLKQQLTTIKGVIGYQDKTPIALATYCYSFGVYSGKPILSFKTFYILPEYRKQGYGRQILKAIADEADR